MSMMIKNEKNHIEGLEEQEKQRIIVLAYNKITKHNKETKSMIKLCL